MTFKDFIRAVEGDPTDTPRRRRGDHPVVKVLSFIRRDLLPLIAIAIAAYAVLGAGKTSDEAAQKAQTAAQQARRNTTRLVIVEQADRDAQRRTSFRLCTRNRDDRAFAWDRTEAAILARGERPRQTLRDLSSPFVLPILDCEPNLTGHGAGIWPFRRQLKFLRAWQARRLPLRDLGVCPNTRIAPRPPGLGGGAQAGFPHTPDQKTDAGTCS